MIVVFFGTSICLLYLELQQKEKEFDTAKEDTEF
jgi:preprotein translocase subunit SecG